MPRRRSRHFTPPIDGKRPLSRDELQVWDYVTKDDKRLPEAEIDWQRVAEEIRPSQKAVKPAESKQAQPSEDQLDSLINKTGFSEAGQAHPKLPQHKGGVDRNSARRLRQGKLPIEATLDMHGMYREEARQQLAVFLQRAYESGKRCVLVVTGKGRFHAEDNTREAGVLKRELPRWLDQPPIAPLVLRHEYAQPHHGGEGAVYILLRRQR